MDTKQIITYKGADRFINGFIENAFYYRLAVVFVCFVLMGSAILRIYLYYVDEKLKTMAVVFSCGSVVIGIFYSILNYENSYRKNKETEINSKAILTFNTACKINEPYLLNCSKDLSLFYRANKSAFDKREFWKIERHIMAQPALRISFISLFNYFECMGLGIHEGIMDERFVRGFFERIFVEHHNKYGNYLAYKRNKNQDQKLYKNFTKLARKWENGE